MKRVLRGILGMLTAVVAAFGAIPVSAATTGATPPNIVYIVSDDQGWKDVGYHGSDIKTPSIDALAKQGARLEAFYAQPMCTPARAALLTGRYPHRYGLQTLVILSTSSYGLATNEWLLPQALDAAGYTTAIVGKWHLGHSDRKYWPNNRGFAHQYGPLLGEIDYFTQSAHGTRDWFRDGKPLNETGYVTELLGNEAVREINAQPAGKPLFLYLAFTAPHAPYQAPESYLAKYSSIDDPARRAYAAMITAMDDQIGRVVHALEQKHMRDNTLIVFQSDNGGPRSARFTGEADMSKSTIPADNGPYRDGKASLYEGGVRVVALANWPGRIEAGTVVDEPIDIVDMYPTLLGLAGGKPAKDKPLDGLDVWPTISRGAPSPRHEVVYDIEPYRAALRQGDWKLVWRTVLPPKLELFDLAHDPSETTNLADANPQVVAQIQQRIEALSREAVPPLILKDAFGAVRQELMGAVSLPDAEAVDEQP